MLTDQEIKKFQLLYRDRFGKEISRERVMDRGYKFARMVEIIVNDLLKKRKDVSIKNKSLEEGKIFRNQMSTF